MPTIDIGDEKYVNGFISEKGVGSKKKVDFYLEILTNDINSRFEFNIVSNRKIAKVDIIDKTKALMVVANKLIFRGCIENVDKFICEENSDLGICLKNVTSKEIYIKSKNSNHMHINDLYEIKHIFDVRFSHNNNVGNHNNENIKKIENTIPNDVFKDDCKNINLTESDKCFDTEKEKENINDCTLKNNDIDNFELIKENAGQKEVTVTLSETDKVGYKKSDKIIKRPYLLKVSVSKKRDIDNKNVENYKLIQTKELLDSFISKSINYKKSMNKGRNTFAFKMSYFNFKKVSLCENIYYTPVDLIVTMFKKQIMEFGRFMICIVLKKNSNYIKHIQIGIPVKNKSINLEDSNNCKFFFNKDENIGYWIINYEP